MASFRHELRINAPASIVWDIVRRPESIVEWFPGIESCTVEGNVRIINLASGIQMPEEIMVIDDLQRRFVYRVTAPIYRFHLGTIDVIELDVSQSLCVYSTTAEPDTLALIIGGATVAALAEIARQAELRVGT